MHSDDSDASSSSPCRVLILNERDPHHPKAGGAETHVFEIFGRLARSGFDVTHFAAGFEGGADEEVVDDVKVKRLGPLARYYPSAVWQTARETRAGLFDVVVECLNKVPYYSPLYSKAPVLALCHHLFGEVAFQQVSWPLASAVWASERLIPPLYRGLGFVSISESTKSDLVRRGVPAERIVVSHPGIDPPRVAVDATQPKACKVVFVGRLEVYKKIDVMLRAMAKLTPRFPNAKITIIGRGHARTDLEKLAVQLGLAERTTFTGFVTTLERDRLLAEARVCVCPSEKEGWGLTVIESNAVGTPVVATNADGLRDSVRDGVTGFLVPDGSVEDFANRIGNLLDDDALATRMSHAAIEWSKSFDWDHAAADMATAIRAAHSTGASR